MKQYFDYIKRAWIGCKGVSNITKMPTLYHFIDYCCSVLFHGCLIRQYTIGQFYNKKYFERKNILTYFRILKIYKKFNSPDSIHILENKASFNKYFASFVKRQWLYVREASFEQFEYFINNINSIIIKPISAEEGIGIRKLECSSISNDDLHVLYQKLFEEDVIIEECIKQHSEMCFNNTSVNTIRVMTILDKNGKGHVLKTILRAGIGDTVVDNYCAGGVIYNVNVKTGFVDSKGISRAGSDHIIHPNSNIVMLGYKIPNWRSVIDSCIRAAEQIPSCRFIGWDVAITDDAIELIEGNHNPDYELYEFIGPIGQYKHIKMYQ